jgi:hypothetical protein
LTENPTKNKFKINNAFEIESRGGFSKLVFVLFLFFFYENGITFKSKRRSTAMEGKRKTKDTMKIFKTKQNNTETCKNKKWKIRFQRKNNAINWMLQDRIESRFQSLWNKKYSIRIYDGLDLLKNEKMKK